MKWQGQVSDPDHLVPESMLLTTELHCLAETTVRGDTDADEGEARWVLSPSFLLQPKWPPLMYRVPGGDFV